LEVANHSVVVYLSRPPHVAEPRHTYRFTISASLSPGREKELTFTM